MLDIPMVEEFFPSHLLVVGLNNSYVCTACGIRSAFNILTLYVTKKYRGGGFGSLTLKKTISVAKKRNLNFISLAVLSNNVIALRLYSKFGFREIIHLENYVTMMLPLTFLGELVYTFLRIAVSLLPVKFLEVVARLVYKQTLYAHPYTHD